MSSMFGGALKMLIPVVERNFDDKKAMEVFDKYMESIELEDDECKKVITITREKNGKVYFSVVGLCNEGGRFYIGKVKKQMPLTTAVKNLITQINDE